jgi:hypothetical protein
MNQNSEIVFVVEESPEGGFEAIALGYSIVTEAETVDEIKVSIIEAVRSYFGPSELPSSIKLHHIKDEVIAL